MRLIAKQYQHRTNTYNASTNCCYCRWHTPSRLVNVPSSLKRKVNLWNYQQNSFSIKKLQWQHELILLVWMYTVRIETISVYEKIQCLHELVLLLWIYAVGICVPIKGNLGWSVTYRNSKIIYKISYNTCTWAAFTIAWIAVRIV